MPEHQGIEKGAKIAKKNIFDFLSFWSGLSIKALQHCSIIYIKTRITINVGIIF